VNFNNGNVNNNHAWCVCAVACMRMRIEDWVI
jgi:hypothetical protein